jgi:hypothetical protein
MTMPSINRRVPPCGRAYFFLSCQEKVAKKKSRPPRRPARPGALRCSVSTGRCGTRAYGPQTVLALFPVAPCAARRRKGQFENQSYINRWSTSPTVPPAPVSPSCSAEQRSEAGGSRRSLFEGHSPELRSRPALRVAQGSRRSRPRNVGIAFSLATFFWRRKRKWLADQRRNPPVQQTQTPEE